MTLIYFNRWYLTLPTGAQGHPKTVEPPLLETYHDEYFFEEVGGWTFIAPCDGVHTKNSKYPRCELRERSDPKTDAAWDLSKGTHEMVYTASVENLPTKKPEVVVGQIHDSKSDVVFIHLSGQKLTLQSSGRVLALLDASYKLGTKFQCTIHAKNGAISVEYSRPGAVFSSSPIKPKAKGPCYFKLGCYAQSNPAHGDGAGEEAKVRVYAVACNHS